MPHNRPVAGLIAVAAVAVLASTVDGGDPEVRVLVPGTPVDGEIRGAERKAFRVPARAGDVLRVTVEQRGADLVLAVADPGGLALLDADDVPGAVGAETAVWVAGTGGDYALELRLRSDRDTGSYRVRAEDQRPATAADRDHAAAAQALSAGARLRAERNAESRRLALAEYEKALGLFRALGDARGEALALAGLGSTANALADFGPARRHLEEALARWRSIGDRWQEGLVLSRLGALALDQTKGDEGAAFHREALAAFRDAGDRPHEAASLNDMGMCYETAGDGPRAQEAYEQALALWRAMGDRHAELSALRNLAARWWSAGDYGLALDRFLEALSAARAAGDRPHEAAALTGVGQLYGELGDLPRALRHLEQGLALAREIGDRRAELVALAAVGYAHRMGGALDKAREAYLQGLEITRGLGVYGQRAAPHVVRSLGIVSLEAGQHAAARDHLERSLASWREVGDLGEQAHVLSFLCRTLSELGDLQGARAHGLEAVSLAERSGVPKVRILSLYRMAELELAAGQPAAAAERIGKALELLESGRRSVRSNDLRASYVATVRDLYDLHVHALMARHTLEPAAGFDAQAFQAADRARARSLLELLAESRANVREGADPALIDRERSLRERLSAAGARALRARDPEAQQAATREIEGLTTELERTEAEIRARTPRYAALTQPQPATVTEVQALLDDQTLLLAYAVGEKGSFAWLLGRGSLHSVALPARPAIDAAARRALAALESEGADPAAAAELSRLVLGPLADRLTGRRVVLVADGALQYVPFAALPHPRDGQPLVVHHEVVGVPSASTRAWLRRERVAPDGGGQDRRGPGGPRLRGRRRAPGDAPRVRGLHPGPGWPPGQPDPGRGGRGSLGLDPAAALHEARGEGDPVRRARRLLAGRPRLRGQPGDGHGREAVRLPGGPLRHARLPEHRAAGAVRASCCPCSGPTAGPSPASSPRPTHSTCASPRTWSC